MGKSVVVVAYFQGVLAEDKCKNDIYLYSKYLFHHDLFHGIAMKVMG